jgi:hypothetical protein
VTYYVNGDRVECEYRDGLKNGKGVVYYVNGDRFENEWRDG